MKLGNILKCFKYIYDIGKQYIVLNINQPIFMWVLGFIFRYKFEN